MHFPEGVWEGGGARARRGVLAGYWVDPVHNVHMTVSVFECVHVFAGVCVCVRVCVCVCVRVCV